MFIKTNDKNHWIDLNTCHSVEIKDYFIGDDLDDLFSDDNRNRRYHITIERLSHYASQPFPESFYIGNFETEDDAVKAVNAMWQAYRDGEKVWEVESFNSISPDDCEIETKEKNENKMKVVFNNENVVSLSAIQLVSVIRDDNTGRFKVRVKHKAEKAEEGEVSYLLGVHPRSQTKKSCEKIARQIEDLTRNPDMPLAQVVELEAFAYGHLQISLSLRTDLAVIALARLCWHWAAFEAPTDEQLQHRTGLGTGEINRITSKDDYKRCVGDLMFRTYTREEFKRWIDGYKNMLARFSKRMRLREDDVQTLVKSVASQHGIVLSGSFK